MPALTNRICGKFLARPVERIFGQRLYTRLVKGLKRLFEIMRIDQNDFLIIDTCADG
jgi:hypothetical protein